MSDNSKPRIRLNTKGEILKLSNIDYSTSGLRVSNYNSGYDNLRSIQDHVSQEQVSALKFPQSLKTFDRMFYDHDVKQGYFLSQIFVEKAFENPQMAYNKESAQSKEAADFVMWNLGNMKHTLQEAIRNAYTCKGYGFAILVKNYEPITYGEYAGKYPYKLAKLSPRAQKTLNQTDPFLINDNGEVMYARQDLKSISNTYGLFKDSISKKFAGKSYIDIPRQKFMLFSYDSTNGNPLGNSVFKSIYKPWREKVLIADYQAIGTSKDVGGTPILTAPSEVLARASEDPNSPDAKFVKNLMTSLGNWHSGDTAYMMLPSDIAEGSTTQKMFDIKLIGIDGGTGKQFDTSKLIEERQKAILNAFGASFSVLGQSGNGSYALADTQKGTHAFYIEKDINFILEVFNRELIPQLLALNGIYLEDKDMPKMVSGTVDEADSDLVSKAIQRISAVGQLPVHPELMNEFLTELGYTYRVPSDVVSNPEKWEEYKANYMPKATSRSGDGMASGTGNGTSQEVSTDDADAGNLDS